jgi:hypothetical protein
LQTPSFHTQNQRKEENNREWVREKEDIVKEKEQERDEWERKCELN